MSNKEVESLRIHVDERLDAIEKLINLSLLSSVMDQMDKVCQQDGTQKSDQRIDEVKEILHQHAFELDKKEIHGDKVAVYIKSLYQVSISKVRLISVAVQNMDRDLIPVFLFERLNGNQRKRMLEERISFCVPNKELYITG